MILKTNELYQTMQKAQELAQRLKQEQRIQDLAQRGHDISKLQKSLGGGEFCHSAGHFASSFGVGVQTVSGFFSRFCSRPEIAPLLQKPNLILAYLKNLSNNINVLMQ